MFCGKCGTKINEGDNFCTNCGAPINNECLFNPSLSETIKKAKLVSDYQDDTFADSMDTINFGHYFMDKGTKKPIDWLILWKEKNKALLISKYALDYKKFNDEYANTTWEESTLRKWLNIDFFQEAFFNKGGDKVLESSVSADFNDLGYSTFSGKDTNDKIFLLSSKELKQYFKSKNSRICYATEYSNVVSRRKVEDYVKPCSYWLRTSGDSSKHAMVVCEDGGYSGGAGVNEKYFIRPAIWVKL